jgi:hypothetical protein
MVVRKKNLLDAFRQAAPEGRKSAIPSDKPASGAGGPFAPTAASSPTSSARSPDKSPNLRFEPVRRSSADSAAGGLADPGSPSVLARLLSDRRVRAVVLIAALIGVGAYFAGRFSAKPTQAADAAGVGDASAGDVSRGALSTGLAAGADLVEKNQAAARMGTAADKALMDPVNRFTIQLIQYKNDEAGKKLAQETAEYLRKQAIPVVSPISLGKNVILVADAKPRTEDLAGLLKHLKLLPGPNPQDKQTPFSSALVVNIDKIVKRR